MTERRGLVVSFVVIECKDGQRDGLVEAVFAEQIGEDGAHLLESQRNLASFLFSSIRDDGEVDGVNLQPARLVGGTGGIRDQTKTDPGNNGRHQPEAVADSSSHKQHLLEKRNRIAAFL